MTDDMTIRNMSPLTQKAYVRAVKNLSLHFMKSPDKLTFENVREYHLHLISRGLSTATIIPIICGIRFFYGTTLGRPNVAEHLPLGRGRGQLRSSAAQDEDAAGLLTFDEQERSLRIYARELDCVESSDSRLRHVAEEPLLADAAFRACVVNVEIVG